MLIPRSRAKLSLFFVLGSAPAGVFACTYDWTVGPGAVPSEAGTPDAGAPDATIADGSQPPDVSVPGDAGSDVEQAQPDAAPSCAALESELDKARSAAQACTPLTGQCTTPITNECGCKNYVADAGSPTANVFASALGAFEDAGCVPACDAGCVNPIGSCLAATDTCYP